MTDADAAVDAIHGAIQQCMNDGLLEPGMLTDWYLVASTIDNDGEPCSMMLSDSHATTPRSAGLLEVARLSVQRDILDWLTD